MRLPPLRLLLGGAIAMEYLATIGVLIAIYVILSSSYDLVIGYGGLSTVAHPIFFAIGAYTAGSAGDPFRHARAVFNVILGGSRRCWHRCCSRRRRCGYPAIIC